MTSSVGLVTGLSVDRGGLNGLLSRGTLNNASRENLSPGAGGLDCSTSPQALSAHPLRSGALGFGPHAMVNGTSPYSDLGRTLPSYSRGTVAATTPLSPNNVSTSPSTPQSNSSNNSNNSSNRSLLSQDIINNSNSGTGLMTPSSIAAALGDHFPGNNNAVSGSTHSSLSSPHGGLDLPHSFQAASSPSLHGLSNNNAGNNMNSHSQQQHHNNNYLYSPNHHHQDSHGHCHQLSHGMLAPGPDGQSYLDLSPTMGGHHSPGSGGSPLSPSKFASAGPMYPWMAIVGPNSNQRRRGRQTYTRYQTLELEKEFKYNRYLTRKRRMKEKKEMQAIKELNEMHNKKDKKDKIVEITKESEK